MTPSDQPPESEEARDPAEMSVDQLSQAFANLMADPDESVPDEESTTDGALRVEDPDDVPVDAVDPDEDTSAITPESIVEAILFVGHPQNEPVAARSVASYLRGVSPQEVDTLVGQLNEGYQASNAPYEIVSEGIGYRMSLREKFHRLRESFYGRVREAKLSQVAVDLLAIVAYHQPIARTEIDRLRGQSSGSVLGQLVRRQLLQVEHTEGKPRTKLYRTTDRFLDLFGLETLEDLPSHDGG